MAPTDDELIKFVSRLQDLRRRSGDPSLSQLSNLTAQVASRIPKSTLHEKLRADSVPDWEFVSAFVHACVIFSRSKNIALAAADTDRDIWRAEHRRMLQAVAAARPAQRKARAAHQELSSPGRYGRSEAIQQQLPADVMTFTGRQEELHLLDQILLGIGTAADTSTVAIVSGPAGVGKTALAVHWSRTAAPRFPDGQLYVDLRGYDPDRPTAPAEALAVMLRSLGLPGAQLGADADERAAQFRSAISDRQMLLVLDNAKDTDHVRLLLPGSALCRTLVTSRDQLTGLVARSGAERVEVKPLPLEQSVSLLDALMGGQTREDPEATRNLARACVGLPLALRVAAERAVRHVDMSLPALVDELSDVNRRLDILDADRDPRTAVRDVLSWSYRHLDGSTAHLFRLVGAQPGPDIDVAAAAALSGHDNEQALTLLELLVDVNLMEKPHLGRYHMHDLLRAYALEQVAIAPWQSEVEQGMARLTAHYVALAAELAAALSVAKQTEQASNQLQRDLPNLVAITAYARTHGLQPQVVELSEALSEVLFVQAYFDAAVTIHTHALAAAEQLDDRCGQASPHQRLSAIYRRWGRYELAYQHAMSALTLSQACSDRGAQIQAHKGLGLLLQRQGRYDEAAEHHLRALELSRELGDRLNEANTLGNLAIVYDLSGRYRPAAEQFEQALEVFRQLGNRTGVGRTLDNLGIIYGREGQYTHALELHQQALEIMREVGDRVGEGASLDNMGTLYRQLGDHEKAMELLRQSLSVRQQHGDRAGEGMTFYSLGALFEDLDQLMQAASYYDQALAIAEELDDQHLRVRALFGQAQVDRKQGRYDSANAGYHASRDLARALSDAEHEAHCLDGLAQIMSMTGKYDLARAFWLDALAIYTSRSMPEADKIRRRLNT